MFIDTLNLHFNKNDNYEALFKIFWHPSISAAEVFPIQNHGSQQSNKVIFNLRSRNVSGEQEIIEWLLLLKSYGSSNPIVTGCSSDKKVNHTPHCFQIMLLLDTGCYSVRKVNHTTLCPQIWLPIDRGYENDNEGSQTPYYY